MKNIMKKLNLLKPDVRSGYLNNGKGQEVRYLNIDENIGRKELKNDIANGAVHFKALNEYLDKKPSRFNLIYCTREEEGLMAVSYLAAIYNRLDKLAPEDYDDEDSYLEDNPDYSFESFDETENPFDPDDEEEEDCEEDSQWIENPWKIPIITANQIMSSNPNSFVPFSYNDYNYGGMKSPKNRLPYWYGLRKENMCIVHDLLGPYPGPSISVLASQLKRFNNNRHVYLIAVLDGEIDALNEEYQKHIRGEFCEIILNYVAGTLNVFAEDGEYRDYYRNVFENWIFRKGYSLEKGFPLKRLADNIMSMNNQDKSSLMEKVVLYTIKDHNEPGVLKEEDFDILKQFESLGLGLAEKEHKSIKKMESELVGLQNVKDQIMGIVEVLRYNKRRASLGLPTGTYHNVHMMIGAPGTAKTTVAELLGNIMAEEHLLYGRRFISVNGAELKGMYVGHSAPKVKALFDEYDIIFIDEAYAVCSDDEGRADSFSQEAIAQLIVELEKHGMDRLVMFAGYGGSQVSAKDNRMKAFLNANPGIRSRINSTVFFDSYTPDEMVDIFRCHARIGKYKLSKKVDNIVRAYFAERVKSADFGNGREARSLLENSMIQAAMRLAKIPDDKITLKMMQEIKAEDVEAAIIKIKTGHMMQNGRQTGKFGFAVN